MSGEAVLENVRRYRAIASLCRQAASFRPLQKSSLLQQAEDWERRAMIELEFHLESAKEDPEPEAGPQVDTRWWLPRREGLFAGLQG
jgi:hypothetical protein